MISHISHDPAHQVQTWQRAKRALAAASAPLIATAAFLAAGPVAAQAAGCYGDYCSGQDPAASGCSADGVTVAWRDITGARLELRWSPSCKTNWARYIQYPRGWYIGNQPVQLRAVQSTGYTQRLNYDMPPGTGTTWSPMIYSPVRVVRAELVVSCTGVGDCAQAALTGQNPIVTDWK